MGADQSAVQVVAATSLVTTAETVAAVSTLVAEQAPTGQGMCIEGVINVTAGTGATAVTIQVRAGSGLTGAVIGLACTHTLAAGASASIPFMVLDPTLVSPGLQYTVTVQQVGATGNGTINLATIATGSATAIP